MNRLRIATKLAAHHLGVLGLLRRTRRRERCLVLRYHAVAPDHAPTSLYAGPDITIPRGLFAAQMRFLKRAYTPVPLGVVAEALTRGRAPQAGTVAVTLDDGYSDNFHQAFPVLREVGMPATVYVVTEPVDGGPVLWTAELRAALMTTRVPRVHLDLERRHEFMLGDGADRQQTIKELTNLLVPIEAEPRRRLLSALRSQLGVNGNAASSAMMLSSAEIRAMHHGGITIGAHTQTHSNMTLIPADQARHEIAGSRERLEAIIGAPVPDFAYPNTGGRYPHYNESVAAIISDLGFRSAVTSRPGVVAAASDRFMLPRIGISPRLHREAPLAVALERYRLFGEVRA